MAGNSESVHRFRASRRSNSTPRPTGGGFLWFNGEYNDWDGRQGAVEGDRVGLLLDCERGQLSIYKGGKLLGSVSSPLGSRKLRWLVQVRVRAWRRTGGLRSHSSRRNMLSHPPLNLQLHYEADTVRMDTSLRALPKDAQVQAPAGALHAGWAAFGCC